MVKRRTATDHTNSRVTDPPTLWLGHVGDSRCYRRRRGMLEQLTHDHSLVEEQLRAGQITAAQAAQSPMRNLITRAIGSQATVEAEIQSHRPQPNDLYLLASDGLTHEVSDEEISEILRRFPKPPTTKCPDGCVRGSDYGGESQWRATTTLRFCWSRLRLSLCLPELSHQRSTSRGRTATLESRLKHLMTEMKTIAVLGAGTMGNGIAHVCARAGFL